MSQNVMIPLSLLDQIVDLLGYWNINDYDPSVRCDYNRILWALDIKKQKLELRDAYAKIIQADNQEDRDEARIRYLQKKRWLRDVEEPPF